MLSTLLATKLHRPPSTSKLVARPRLTQRLDEGLQTGHRLFLIVAPPGYGKTTLVTEWLATTSVPSAWLSLDEADNDPLRFFTYLVAALQKTLGPELAGPVQEGFPMAPQSPETFVLPLINDLATLEQPMLLALDDYHVITEPSIQDAMGFLLRRAPPNLHLVVITRADPPFPLPRLRVRGRLTEIRDRDLRFTPGEMTAFLNALHRLNLAAEQITALESRTEGWAAGVQLAALSLQGSSPEQAAEFIRAFSGSHHYIVDYLLEEVLGRQPDAVREFLLRTSILERMCASLCDAVVGTNRADGEAGKRGTRESGKQGIGEVGAMPDTLIPDTLVHATHTPDSQSILEYLQRANLFLVPLDDERSWYRYHHLFVDVLRGILRSALLPAQIAGLHQRAGEWFRQSGFVAEAVHHALQAGDPERAAEIVEETAWSMVLHAELGTLRKWIEALPGASVSARPWLRIYYAWALFFADSDAAEIQMQGVEQQFRSGAGTALSGEMQGHIAAIRAWIAYIRGESQRSVVLSRQALELHPQMDATVRSGLMIFLATGYLIQNDLPACTRAYAEALELAHSSGNVMHEVLSRAALGTLCEMVGRLHEAEAIFQEALQTAIENRSPVAGQPYACLAHVHLEWNDLASVKRYAEKLIESSGTWGVVDARACGHLNLATVLQAQGDVAGANRAIAEASEVMHRHPLELRSAAWLGATRAALWLAQGKLDDARHWAARRGLSTEAELGLGNVLEHLALVRILLAEGRVADARRLLSRLQDLVEPAGRLGQLIEVLVLQAIARDMQGDTRSGLGELERAVSLARQEGYVRVFLDGGKPIENLLKLAVTQWRDRAQLAYARKLLSAFVDAGATPAMDQDPLAGVLSERELEVLCLIAAGSSNQEIADELVIALGTAKRHAANIFDKLDVRSRTEAVAKARELGLL